MFPYYHYHGDSIYLRNCAPFGAHILFGGDDLMETRVAIIAIIVEDRESVSAVNDILHDYAENIIGRMGLPYRQKGINIISVVVDAPHDVISALSGKIGRIDGVSAKTVYSK